MGHVRRPVLFEELECLFVGEMTMSSTNAFLEVVRITPFIEHFLVVVGFEKSCMAALEVFDEVLAGCADIGEDTNVDVIARDNEGVRLCSVMELWESRDAETADLDRRVREKWEGLLLL